MELECHLLLFFQSNNSKLEKQWKKGLVNKNNKKSEFSDLSSVFESHPFDSSGSVYTKVLLFHSL